MTKYTHRSQKLDFYLDKQVEIRFKDGATIRGVLKWIDDVKTGYMPNMYLLLRSLPISFRKSHVKNIRGVSNA